MKLGDKLAFPRAGVIGPNGRVCDEPVQGMNLRQYFAGLAMQGLLAGREGNSKEITEAAVRYADALLKELEK